MNHDSSPSAVKGRFTLKQAFSTMETGKKSTKLQGTDIVLRWPIRDMEIYFFYFHEILKLALFHVLVKFLFRQFKTFAGKLKIFSKLNYYLKKTQSFLKTQLFVLKKKKTVGGLDSASGLIYLCLIADCI